MRLPRDISSTELIKLPQKLGNQVSRQKGSHIRLSTKNKESIILPFQITIR